MTGKTFITLTRFKTENDLNIVWVFIDKIASIIHSQIDLMIKLLWLIFLSLPCLWKIKKIP